MTSRLCVGVACAVLGLAVLSPAKAQYNSPISYGACGGVMTGYNGRPYPCEANRKPACEQSSGRCVCLLRTECGARRNEPF